MSNYSYNVIIERLKAFADGHYQIRKFSHGQIDLADMPNDYEYPFMHVVPVSINPIPGEIIYNFQIIFADLPRDKETKAEYQREAISDMARLALDLIAEIQTGRQLFGTDVEIETTPTIDPFIEEYKNTLTGVDLGISIKVPYDWSACDIPADYNVFQSGSSGGSGSGGGGIILRVNGVNNGSQTILDLIEGDNITITDNGDGTVTFDVTGGAGGGLTCEDLADCQIIQDINIELDGAKMDIGNLQTSLSGKENVSNKDTDATLSANSNTKYPSQKAVKTYIDTGLSGKEDVANKDTDDTLASNSNTKYPSQKAVKTYVDTGLATKANTSHTHSISDVTGLQTALDGKASASHTHAISDVTGLQTALDGKAATAHTHTASEVTDFNTAALLAAPAETTTTTGSLINGATSKTTPVDADQVGLMDSAASNVLKKLSWLNIKATLKTYFDTLYAPVNSGPTIVRVISDITNSNTDTLANVTGLLFTMTSGRTYRFRIVCSYNASSTAIGSRWTINGPSTSFLSYRSMYTNSATAQTLNTALSAYQLPAASNATSGAGSGNIAIIEGFITPSANGDLQVQFACESNTGSITFKAGFIEYQDIT